MTCLYRHFDKDGVLLYVGVSMSPLLRTSAHKRSRWHKAIYCIKLTHFDTPSEAYAAEEIAIKSEMPIFNIQLKPRAEKIAISTAKQKKVVCEKRKNITMEVRPIIRNLNFYEKNKVSKKAKLNISTVLKLLRDDYFPSLTTLFALQKALKAIEGK